MYLNQNFHYKLKRLRRVINAIIWSLAGLYLCLILLLRIPAVQSFLGSVVSNALGEKLATEVKVGSVDLGMLNRIIVDDVVIKDQAGKDMLLAPRLSVKVRLSDLISGKITVSSAQLFGLKANLYKRNAQEKTNFQFVIDSLASKDTTKHTPLNLEISSLIIRRGEVAYNQLDDYNRNHFSPKHINLHDISAHLILNKLTDDSLDLKVKKIALKDESGLELKRLSLRFIGGTNDASLSEMLIELPQSSINIPELTASYKKENKKFKFNSFCFKGKIVESKVTPCDLKAFSDLLNNYTKPVSLSADVSGTTSEVSVHNLNINQSGDLSLLASGKVSDIGKANDWTIDIENLSTTSDGIRDIATCLGKADVIPAVVDKLGKISLSGDANKEGNATHADLKLSTDAGGADININKVGNQAMAKINAEKIDLQRLTDNNDLGLLSGIISATGNVDGTKILSAKGDASISDFTFKNHTYNDIKGTADYIAGKDLMATVSVNETVGKIDLTGNYNLASKKPNGSIDGTVENLDPAAMGLTDKWAGSTFCFAINGDFIGDNINNALGNLTISDLVKRSENEEYHLNTIEVKKVSDGNAQKMTFKSDFGTMMAEGRFNYSTLFNSITNAVYDRLPTTPGLKKKPAADNHFNIYATINDTKWAEKLLDIDLQLFEPAHLVANIDDSRHKVDLTLDASMFVYKGKEYHDGYIRMSCPNDTMKAVAHAKSYSGSSDANYTVRAQAIDNHLTTKFQFQSHGKQHIEGELNADANFYEQIDGVSTAEVKVLPSTVFVNDSIWNITPARIKYFANNLEVDNFSIHHKDQHITINGKATKSPTDLIEVELNDVNVSYILSLINFHAVEFAGHATGKAKAHSIFSQPEAEADLHVKDFAFETGCLGDLDVHADWNLEEGAINVDGKVVDKAFHTTDVTGYISPKNKDINLHVNANGTDLAFLQKYTRTFLNDIHVNGWGEVDVVGPLKQIQLLGKAQVQGSACVTPLNTHYYLRGDSVYLRPGDICLTNDSIYDRDGHLGIINGHLRHRFLNHFTFDIDVEAKNLLAYDTHDFGEDTFYGTAYCTGNCTIKGKDGELVIDVDAVPNQGTVVVYNAASPDALTSQEFITFHDRNQVSDAKVSESHPSLSYKDDMEANLYLNLLIHANPDATLRLLMDQSSGDYISLNGNGVIRAAYYNKGSFDLFGNYVVDHGVYKLTIQNVIKRDFQFLQGGTIAFGGDAYNAALNLQAQYTVNGVPLSDLNVGKSFSNNNIRVNCLMDITGTPYQPRVDFSLDMPTVSAEAKQMITSLMNSEEEMKQQVVYLLAIGRFFNQGNNNAASESTTQSQTSLAMQSILSGTLSQQLSTILSGIVKNDDWNFGANISTGDEGLYNAEYEGIVSGRLLNNRLLLNGQFGYRNNQTTNSTFIGDFDVRYLLVPSGSMAVKVYNQTNDKYFTKNSLNTQGVGLIFKKDFNTWRDFFIRRRKE